MLSSLIKSADWKTEKHVPVIAAPEVARAGEPFEVEVSVGKEIPHPNTLEHHIVWAALYFVADGSQLPVELARAEFRAHGPDLFTSPTLKATVSLPTSGTLHATASCNIHGLWEAERKIPVERAES